MIVAIAQEVRGAVEAAARAASPREYCAALLGHTETDGDPMIVDHVRLRNADGRPGCFAVGNADLRHAGRVAQHRGLAVLALFHSHPAGTQRLSHDDRQALEHSRWPWVVGALQEPGSAAWFAHSAETAEPLELVFVA